jgi:GNAT superfamily N-acetyltransferase
MQVRIRDATLADIPNIQSIARRTWPSAYGEILSWSQIEYMLDKMYSTDALSEQMGPTRHWFGIAELEGVPVGFVSFQHDYVEGGVTKIHKLYVLPEAQGKQVGYDLVLFVQLGTASVVPRQEAITLNVNKFNRARVFYERVGFKIVGEEDIDIGSGFLMEDFIMRLPLAKTE